MGQTAHLSRRCSARRSCLLLPLLTGALASDSGALAQPCATLPFALQLSRAAGGGGFTFSRAEVARDVLPEGLVAVGWDVDVVTAYRTLPAQVAVETAEQVADADAITFTSSSTVTNYVATGAPVPPVVAAIGPVTAATAQEAGLTVTVEAGVHTLDGLVDALVGHFSR